MYADSHCHLDFEQYADTKVQSLVARAREQQVNTIISIGCDLERAKVAVAIAEAFPEVFAVVGIHPNDVYELPTDWIQKLKDLALSSSKVVGFGETGLDYYRDHDKVVQQKAFRNHIELSIELDKPLVLHMRGEGAYEDALTIVNDYPTARGIAHCFGSDLANAEKYLELGYFIGITGIVTFSNARDVAVLAKEVPLERMVLETDAPFLAPTPHRGQRNEPSYIPLIASKVAEIRGISVEEVARMTTENTKRVYGIGE